jgi:hypothetical protein
MSFVSGKNKQPKLILKAPQKNCVKNLFGVKRLPTSGVVKKEILFEVPTKWEQVYFFQRNAEEIQQLFCRASSFVTFLQRKVKLFFA